MIILMKIFLTGEPHSGKSTLINKILSHFDDKIGFVTNEVLENGERKGFELTSSIGVRAMFARLSTPPLFVSQSMVLRLVF